MCAWVCECARGCVCVCGIILVSVELDEVMGLADRILVMNAGREVGTIGADVATRHALGMMMTGAVSD